MPFIGNKPSAVPLTSADIADSIITSAKITDATIVNGDIANATIALAKLSATGTPSAATFLRGDNAWGAVTSGLTEADQWRLTTSLTMSTSGLADITANLERNDNASFNYIGTGMTQSSGVFTFPSTGIYLILIQAIVYGNGNQTDFASVHMSVTTDNSSYATTQVQTISQMAKSNGYATGFGQNIVDVTSTSLVKIKFTQDTGTTGIQLYGSTTINGTCFTFIKLGDT